MTLAYAVMGETEHGKLRLRVFDTLEEAESHPVILARWKRVWIEQVVKSPTAPKLIRDTRVPWNTEDIGPFTYLIDAGGAKIATPLGSRADRDKMVAVLVERGLFG